MVPRISLLPTAGSDLAELNLTLLRPGRRMLYAERVAVKQLPICSHRVRRPIRQLQEETQVSPSVILGHAMAHELGHLLLGTKAHSPGGLMRAHWTREDLANTSKGNLRFSKEQCLTLRSRLTTSKYVETATVAMARH
jgi:hypothetical protein